jgi:hypothetical protein
VIPTVSAEFVYHMEDVLDLYAEPEDPKRPRVCFDECPYQLISEVRQVIPAAPGQPERHDYEYKREGTCNLFMFVCPERGGGTSRSRLAGRSWMWRIALRTWSTCIFQMRI